MRKGFTAALVCLITLLLGVPAHASLVGATYTAFANDAGVQQINDVGNVSSGLASASVFADSMYAGYTGTVAGKGAGAGMYWTAPADTTFRVAFDYAITNASSGTSFQVLGMNDGYYEERFNFITSSGSGHFDQTLSLLAGEHFSINVNALGIGGPGVSLTNMNVSAVPIPGAVWLLGSGLFGLVAVRRRMKK